MSMTLTIQECLTAEPSLDRLLESVLPFKLAYHLAKLRRLIGAETQIYQTQRNALIKEMGTAREPTPDEFAKGMRGEMSEVLPDRYHEFFERQTEMLAHEITIEWNPLLLSDLEKMSDVKGADLVALYPLIAEESAPAPSIAETAPESATVAKRRIRRV